jgi:hypothetical protein
MSLTDPSVLGEGDTAKLEMKVRLEMLLMKIDWLS